jgi:predicted transcriptional regulator
MPEEVDEDKRTTLRRFAALGAATPFVSLGGDGSDARDAIVGYLSTTPGAHFSKVRDDLRLGTGETQHHLRSLLEEGAIESRRDGDYRRFFPAGTFSAFEKTALGYLRRDTPRRMLIELLRDPTASGSDLADAVGVSGATVSTYARELESVGLLDRTDGYAIERPETVLVLLVRYADSFDEAAKSLAADASDLIAVTPPVDEE